MDKSKSVVAAVLILCTGAASAHTVYFNPSTTSAAVGSSFTMDIEGRNFFIKSDKGGVNFNFDPNVLQVESIDVNSLWELPTSAPVVDNSAGSVTGLNFASATGQGPTFDLATVTFKAVGGGNSNLGLTENASNRFSRAGQPGATIPGFSAVGATVSVTAAPVPVPATVWLLGSALATMFVGRRKAA